MWEIWTNIQPWLLNGQKKLGRYIFGLLFSTSLWKQSTVYTCWPAWTLNHATEVWNQLLLCLFAFNVGASFFPLIYASHYECFYSVHYCSICWNVPFHCEKFHLYLRLLESNDILCRCIFVATVSVIACCVLLYPGFYSVLWITSVSVCTDHVYRLLWGESVSFCSCKH